MDDTKGEKGERRSESGSKSTSLPADLAEQ